MFLGDNYFFKDSKTPKIVDSLEYPDSSGCGTNRKNQYKTFELLKNSKKLGKIMYR